MCSAATSSVHVDGRGGPRVTPCSSGHHAAKPILFGVRAPFGVEFIHHLSGACGETDPVGTPP